MEERMTQGENLAKEREEINRIDREMAGLFEERMAVCARIAAYKKQHGLPVKDKAREKEVIKRNCGFLQNREMEEYYVLYQQNVMDLSCRYQSRLAEGRRVAYCGSSGAYAQLAAGRMFPEAELTPFPDFAAAYAAVESGAYDSVVLPLENSLAGEVGAVMDILFSGTLYVNQVLDLPIRHALVALPGATPAMVKKVLSHPQALRQCEGYIREHGFQTENFSNTALAAEEVAARGDITLAAIASEETAERLGLAVLEKEVNDSRTNTTRFAAFSRGQSIPAPSGKREDENFILVFTVQNEAGALAGALNIVGAHGFNMRSLRSRPMRDLPWNYFFYIEAEGNVHTENGRELLQELSAVCARLRLLGSYYVRSEEEEV